MKATKKPVTIDAIYYNGKNADKVLEFCEGNAKQNDDGTITIHTLEGDHIAIVTDYIIKGVKGEFYPCKEDIFEQTYDIIDESNEPISLDNVTVTFKGEPLTDISIPILKVRAEVRYFEDGVVNGENDISYEEQEKGVRPRIPCVERNVGENLKAYDMWSWCLEIDPNSGFIRNWPLGFKASVHYKVCDGCHIEYIEKGKKICDNERDGYVPDFLCPNGEGYGDYMIMEIDGGFIQKWNFEKFAEWVKIASSKDEE